VSENNWDEIVESVRAKAQAMHGAREKGLTLSRSLTQTSARCIRHIHRRQWEEAAKLLQQAKEIAAQAREAMEPYPQILYAGYLHDSEKEMVEAAAVMAIVTDQPYPSPEDLNAMPMSYLNGMGEASSECRRFVLDEVRHGRIEEAERILARMEEIYEELITFDYSDAMTGGLRRTCDALRAVIERTRSDLTTTASQVELVRELRATREKLG
jgi:translin